MTSHEIKSGDWRPSPTGAFYHYGHGPVALCGSPRTVNDSKLPKSKCLRCVRILHPLKMMQRIKAAQDYPCDEKR